MAEPEVLLLDEPSNYLDLPTIEWLQRYLREFKGTLLLISHDRYLLNALTGVTIEVSAGEVERYAGNYDAYVSQRELRFEQRMAAQKNQDRRREQIEAFVTRFRAHRIVDGKAIESRIEINVFATDEFKGTAVASDDAAALTWAAREELDSYQLTPRAGEVIQQARAILDRSD